MNALNPAVMNKLDALTRLRDPATPLLPARGGRLGRETEPRGVTRPDRKTWTSGVLAASALAVIAPMPGTPARRREGIFPLRGLDPRGHRRDPSVRGAELVSEKPERGPRRFAQAPRGAEPELRRALAGLGAALPRRDEGPAPDRPSAPLALHRDWTAGRKAGVRAALAMLAIDAVWVATGWAGGPMVMLGTAIMISVISTSDNSFAILPRVAMGQALGAALAIACRWLVWPHLGGGAAMILAMLPFIPLGGVTTGVPRLQIQPFDYNMALLLLLQPAWPPGGDLRHALGVGAAVASAPSWPGSPSGSFSRRARRAGRPRSSAPWCGRSRRWRRARRPPPRRGAGGRGSITGCCG